jgi:hypothetical protein
MLFRQGGNEKRGKTGTLHYNMKQKSLLLFQINISQFYYACILPAPYYRPKIMQT